MMNVGVLFRNNEELVVPFFYFLRRSTKNEMRVFAVDDGSTDDTQRELGQCMQGMDITIRHETKQGIAKGRNSILEAMKNTCGKYEDLFLLDSDLFIARYNSLDMMSKKLITSPDEIGFVMGVNTPYYANDGLEYQRNGFCFVLIRGKVLEEIGQFDEQYSMFYDDTVFFEKAKAKGYGWVEESDAIGLHQWGGTIRHGSEGGNTREETLAHDKEIYDKRTV
jgi:GT2 family glycosyltransferase